MVQLIKTNMLMQRLGGPIPLPKTIANLALWLDGNDASTVNQVGGLVTQWDDKSGNGNNAVQVNAAEQPTYNTGIGGIVFNDFDSLELPPIMTLPTTSTPETIFVVFETMLLQGTQYIYAAEKIGDGTKGEFELSVSTIFSTTSILTGEKTKADNTGVAIRPMNSFIQVNNVNIFTLALGVGDSTFRVNRSMMGIDGTNTPDIDNAAILRVGSGEAFGTTGSLDGLVGNVREVLHYKRRLPQSEIDTLETYLRDKWGTV